MQDSKFKKLKSILKNSGKVVIAYSGGLDSAFLLKVAVDILGKRNVIAVTARSETYPGSEYAEARQLAKEMGARHITIHTEELKLKKFKSNPVNRCYFCKKELFRKLDTIKNRYGMAYVVDGTNFDDLKDIRYGMKAADELKVGHPLLEARMGKDDIRKLSKRLRLPTWSKPSFACLASRIPFGSEITEEDLRRVEKAEAALRRLGFSQVRVRLHGDVARIELLKQDFGKAIKLSELISGKLKSAGFVYITLDLRGYRTGSMHEGK